MKASRRRRAVNGVMNALYQRGIVDKNAQYEIIFFYCGEQRKDLPALDTLGTACLFIQKDFNKFMQWLLKEKITC